MMIYLNTYLLLLNYVLKKSVWTAVGDVSANIIQGILVVFLIGSFLSDNPEILYYLKNISSIDLEGNSFDLNDKEPQNFISFILPLIEQVMIDMNWDKQKIQPNLTL